MAQWVTDTAFPDLTFRTLAVKEVIPAHGPLHERLQTAFSTYKPNIVICHRDAEAITLAARSEEIETARVLAGLPISVVSVVPVKMIEAWLLANEHAIRSAADNRNGTIPLNLPAMNTIEALADPKSLLFTILRTATNLPTQRLKKFNHFKARSRIADFIDDFQHLRGFASFRAFEAQLIAAVVAAKLRA